MYHPSHLLAVITAALLCCCTSASHDDASLPNYSGNAIYHWKSVYNPDSAETEFMESNKIRRVYVKYFDVSMEARSGVCQPIPVATTVFSQLFPGNVEVVPAVFITLEALKSMGGKVDVYAGKIVQRILSMNDGNNIKNVAEVQFDCDWTASTRELYFSLLSKIKEMMDKHGIHVSATIRLHQLGQTPPPVDRGVLMVYNTGSFADCQTSNSIIDIKDVMPYVERYFDGGLDYDLPLDVAYPAYSWSVLFRDDKFHSLLRMTDFSDKNRFEPLGDNRFKVKSPDKVFCKGDVIRVENSDFSEIIEVKSIIEKNLSDKDYSVILYHLDSKNLSNYTQDEINKIYSRN